MSQNYLHMLICHLSEISHEPWTATNSVSMAKAISYNSGGMWALLAVHFCCHISCVGGSTSGALSWTPTGPVGSSTFLSVSADCISACSSINESAAGALLALRWQALYSSALRRSWRPYPSRPQYVAHFLVCLGAHHLLCPWALFLLIISGQIERHFEIFTQISQFNSQDRHNLHTSKLLW
jgi:hypothetical protein